MATQEHIVPAAVHPAIRVLWYIFDLLEFFLLVRLILVFLQANPGARFTAFIFSITYPLVQPFLNVFPNYHAGGITIEWASILAMIVYWLVAIAAVNILLLLARSLRF